MPRPEIDNSYDLDRPGIKDRLCAFIRAAKGWHKVALLPECPTRSGQQNRMWWSTCVTPLVAKLREQSEKPMSKDRAKALAHRYLVAASLGTVQVLNPLTGELTEEPCETHGLSIEDFSEMRERAAVWLAQCGIIVEDPDPNWRSKLKGQEVVA